MSKDYLAMITKSPEDAEQHGVKGMKWGVRKDKAVSGAKKVGKFVGDVKFEMEAKKQEVEWDIAAKASDKVKEQDLPAIKSKPEYQKASKLKNRLLHPRDPMTKKYRQEVKQAYVNRMEEEANSRTNSSGTRQYTITDRKGELPGSPVFWELRTRELAHADEDNVILLRPVFDSDGFITDVLVDNEFEHSGVKGMKWGIRKKTSATDSSSTTTVAKSGNSSMTVAKHPSNESHGERYDRLRAQIKKDGPNALSTDDLNFVNARSDALKRIQNMDGAKKNWLADTGKQVMRETSKKLMKDLVQAGVNEIIVKPLVKK